MDTQTPKKIDRRARIKLPPLHAGYRSAEERVHDFEEILVLHTPATAQAEAKCRGPSPTLTQASLLRKKIPRRCSHGYSNPEKD